MPQPFTPETRSTIFTISAATLNAVDTADQTLYTFPTNTRFIRVPVMLHLVREAGTAYTWTQTSHSAEHFTSDIQDYNREDQYSLDVCWNQTKANWNSAQTTDAAFKIPQSFLAQTTETELLVFPFVDGQNFGTDGKTKLVLRAPRNVTVSGGTGNLVCQLIYEDHFSGVLNT